MSAASEGVGLEFDPSSAPELEVAQWITKQLNREIKRISSMGQQVLPVTAKNTGIVREESEVVETANSEAGKAGSSDAGAQAKRTTIINRVELSSSFDFSRVEQLMTSEPIPCPCKPGYSLIFLVMVVKPPAAPSGHKSRRAPPPPLLAPYIYDSRIAENDLSTFSLVNNDGEAAVVKIENATVVTEE
jgi:hypothetical protein